MASISSPIMTPTLAAFGFTGPAELAEFLRVAGQGLWVLSLRSPWVLSYRMNLSNFSEMSGFYGIKQCFRVSWSIALGSSIDEHNSLIPLVVVVLSTIISIQGKTIAKMRYPYPYSSYLKAFGVRIVTLQISMVYYCPVPCRI